MKFENEKRDEEEEAFLPPSRGFEDVLPRKSSSRNCMWYLRIVLEIAMAVAIAVLLIRPFPRATEKSSPIPKLPKKTYTFAENPKYLHEDMFESETSTLHTLHNWIELSADARGYVVIKDAEQYSLPAPYTVRINVTHEGPAYMMSAFHQLHCLSYIVQHFQTGFGGVALTQEVAHHSAHCFDYLRQSIMCAADTSLEGKTGDNPGWGSQHKCTDWDALLKWANTHGAYRWPGNMPTEAVL